jgi:hypothetical protein
VSPDMMSAQRARTERSRLRKTTQDDIGGWGPTSPVLNCEVLQ